MADELVPLTHDPLKKYAESIVRQYERRKESTPPSLIKQRKGSHGKTFSYIKRGTAISWLDANFGSNWDWEVLLDSSKEYAGHFSITGKLTVRYEDGTSRIVQCVGQDSITVITDQENPNYGKPQMKTYVKNAETDALKRCVNVLGGFEDIYNAEDFDDELDRDFGENDVYLHFYLEKILPKALKMYKAGRFEPRNLFNQVIQYYQLKIEPETLAERYKEDLEHYEERFEEKVS